MSLLYLILAGLGLSFLVFIHELGHFLVARKLGMRVEVFSIGLGKPAFAWTHKGVKWQICFLLFGGYVKIAGMEKEDGIEPREIKDGFYAKSPLARILVAIVGPIVNIIFAFVVFAGIWALGGRAKPFDEYTHIIGYVDPTSELAAKGIKAGDTITRYNDREFTGFKDLIYSGILNEKSISIKGEKVNYFSGKEESYSYDLVPYYRSGLPREMKTIGVLQPASIFYFNGFEPKEEEFSPMAHANIAKGDRILWANGEIIFSLPQLSKIVNDQTVFLTIKRAGAIIHLNVPRISLSEIQMTAKEKDEFVDWKRELKIDTPLRDLFFLTHSVDELGVVENKYHFIDNDLIQERGDDLLKRGDKIVAVYGNPVANGLNVFKEIAERKVIMIVQKAGQPLSMNFHNQDEMFRKSVNWQALQEVVASIGLPQSQKEFDLIKVLNPVIPISYSKFQKLLHQKEPKEKEKEGLEYIFLGSLLKSETVQYNPSPFVVFADVTKETWYTLKALVGGKLSPKWLSGPVGIVKVMHDGLSTGIKEALYWMGLISLNLGLINLLPIPVLDGGHICFAIWEFITKKPISSKTMERMVLPFVILLIMFFVYVTYQDVLRIFFH